MKINTLLGLGMSVFWLFSADLSLADVTKDCSLERKVISVQDDLTWAPGFKKTTWTVKAGCDPLNRFQFHRVVSQDLENAEKGRIFLNPGEGWGFQNFETSPDYLENGQIKRATSMAGNLASQGYAVYGFTPRSSLIPGKCERCFPFLKACPSGPRYDCSAIKKWDFESLLDDTEFAIDQIRMIAPFTNPMIGGISLGAIVSIALVNRHPDNFKGLFIWEGMLTSKNPIIIEKNAKQCATLTSSIKKDHFIETQGMGTFKKLYKSFKRKPNGWSPFGKLLGLPFRSSHADVFYYATTMDQPDAFNERYVYAMGNWRKHEFNYASVDIIGQALSTVSFYLPIAVTRDYSCAIAGKKDYVSNLGAFHGPVLSIGQEFGFGKSMEDNLNLFSKNQVQSIYYPGMGHGDTVFSVKRSELVDQPLLNWLNASALTR